uniref:Uncharacterized protein n=1 Tax=Acrobeloides nanus TaxID=290746 RepID=A0A914DQ90_9BILA
MIELYQHWTDQTFSGLFAAVASKKLRNAPAHVKDKVAQCSKNANTVILHAKCISNLLDGKLSKEKEIRKAPSRYTERVPSRRKLNEEEKVYNTFVQEKPMQTVYHSTKKIAHLKVLSLKKQKVKKTERFPPSRFEDIDQKQNQVERIRDHAIQEKENKKQLKEAQKQFEDYRFRGLHHENIDVDEMIEHPQRLKELLDTKSQDDPKTNREQKLLGLVRDVYTIKAKELRKSQVFQIWSKDLAKVTNNHG